MVRVGIIGATGYTGNELLKSFALHPEVEVGFCTSESYAGQKYSEAFPCPYEHTLIKAEDADISSVDVAFLCLPHGVSVDMVRRVRDAGVRAIDLSADFRLQDPSAYQRWYNHEHSAPEMLPEAVFGLPEVYRRRIAGADLVANPGCYPTSVILGLRPLAAAGAIADRRIIVDSKTGVSGAGRGLSLTTHFVEVNENLAPYNIGYRHRHISEMEQELDAAGGGPYEITFSPHLLPVTRGILSTMYVWLGSGWDLGRVRALYEETYAGEPFVHVLPDGKLATLAHVNYTNRCVISLSSVREGQLIVCSAIDNLVKGASGQAVQNMNIMFGLDERLGLIG
ncbi:MAG: N-acetyl-gamma-glutamyl-phosphate reductase [Anaerolineae bacterium]|nr:N-acetyl-gamma-glutamyl-phosphate reductase [Anaerolineae bacterium]